MKTNKPIITIHTCYSLLYVQAKEFSKNPGLTLEIDIKVNGLDLKHAVSVKTEVEVVRLKVISGGRVIDDEQSLQEQGVKVRLL